MSRTAEFAAHSVLPRAAADTETEVRKRAREAFYILRFGFTVAPIVAGLDKFLQVLTDWDKYLPLQVNAMVGGHGHELMMAVGVIEIVAGIGVAMRPRLFAYVVAAWLLAIIGNLLLVPGTLDIALRDLGLALGALALARLSGALASDAPRSR
jgi:hypothetical protein